MSPAEIEVLVEQVGDEILGRLGLSPAQIDSLAAPQAPPSVWPRPQGGYGAAVELLCASAEMTEREAAALCARARSATLPVVWTPCLYTASVVAALEGYATQAGTLIDFPDGAGSTPARLIEIETALRLGAQLVNLVVGAGRVRSTNPLALQTEVRAAASLCSEACAGLAVTLDAATLSDDELSQAASAALAGGADALCAAASRHSHAPSSDRPIALLRQIVGGGAAIIAGGHIVGFPHAAALIAAGADRVVASDPWAILDAAPAD